MGSLKAQGTVISIGDGATPEAFTQIGKVKSYSWGRTRDTIDVTPIDAEHEALLSGLRRGAQLTLEIVLDPDDTGQGLLQDADDDGEEHNYRILASDGLRSAIVPAIVTDYSESGAVNEAHAVSVTLKVSNAVTISG